MPDLRMASSIGSTEITTAELRREPQRDLRLADTRQPAEHHETEKTLPRPTARYGQEVGGGKVPPMAGLARYRVLLPGS